MTTTVDYIIVGQGLAGSTLALESIKRGKTVCVFDEPQANRASMTAAGICNPITGKVMIRSYLADTLFPFLQSWYPEAETILGEKFFRPLPVYRPFLSEQERQQWGQRSSEADFRPFVRVRTSPFHEDKLVNPHGGLEVLQSGVLDVVRWVTSVRSLLIEKGMYRDARFDEADVHVADRITVRGISATRLIYCNGISARQSPWFGWLPLRPLKGETLTLRMQFPEDRIISRGVYAVPLTEPGTFVVGSTYQHEPFSPGVSEEGRHQVLDRFAKLFKMPAEVIHQDWGIRPTVTDRRPLLGRHPRAENVIIFNGLGTKGVSLAPYFASVLLDWIERDAPLPAEVNISRFKSLYSNG